MGLGFLKILYTPRGFEFGLLVWFFIVAAKLLLANF
jgi:hypothetical protein